MKTFRKVLAILMTAIIFVSGMAVSASAATKPAATNERYSVLVLDISGSMYGQPIEDLKQAATMFCEQVISSSKSTNKIAIVTFESYVSVLCEFTNDVDTLTDAIATLTDRGSTYLGRGLATAKTLLDAVDENVIKNMVVMCDGQPHDEQYAYQVVDSCPLHWNIYGLYFSQAGYYEPAANVMKRIGRNGYYNCDTGNLLVENMGINTSGTVNNSDANIVNIRIACPVDVEVTLYGETLSKYNPETLFGSLTITEGGENGDIKDLTLSYNKDMEIKIIGYDYGTMDCSIKYLCNDQELYEIDYPTVDVTPTSQINAHVDVENSDTALEVDNDGDGVVDETVSPNKTASSIWYKIQKFFDDLLFKIKEFFNNLFA